MARSLRGAILKRFGDLLRRYQIQWEHGQIDYSHSSIFVRDLARKIEPRYTGVSPERVIPGDQAFKPERAPSIDVASGTFRAQASEAALRWLGAEDPRDCIREQ